ncbi:MAG: Uma2 family endonuclease [Verrucomicrobia bacterium]|nr:Uma2 family endonuclease [Verrucomicrobiota bacterium]
MAIPKTVRHLTEAEYLAIERAAEFKSEFFDGEMFAMAGGSPMHSLIATNLAREVGNRLKGRPCVPFNSDLRLKIMATGLHTYPDLSVVCGPLEFADQEEDTIINPTLLAEVLSDSTEGYDRGKKFEHYRQIPTLREYLLVSQKEPRIEQFVRGDDGEWRLREAAGMEAEIQLPSLQITLPLAEVFAQVKFEAAPLRTSSRPSV